MGLGNQLCSWLRHYLTGRTYTVRVNGELSDPFAAPTGVPQGSILGPLLFILFVNDLPTVCNSPLFMYADDTTLWRILRSPDDVDLLQEGLDAVHRWSVAKALPLNVTQSNAHPARKQ
jgi:hypothetical protein